jgi:hypothetical protein
MTPKEVILEDKYCQEDLKAAEKALFGESTKDELRFKSGKEMTEFLKSRVRK